MREELLYTQEDIDEWMRACDELQVHLRELEDDIKAKDKQLAIYKRALELACKDRCHRCYSMVTGTCQYDPKTYDCKSADDFVKEAKKEFEEGNK